MTIDWTEHNDALYDTFGTEALLTTAGSAAAAVVTVIDKVRGALVMDSSLADVQSAIAMCAIRKTELDANAIEFGDLDGGTVEFNGLSWRIEAHRNNSPDGEMTGEVYLLLCKEAEDS
jgi:hypothetical protein